MKSLLIIAIAAMGFNLMAQNPRLDKMADQVAQDIKARMDKRISPSHIQVVSIVDDCHDVSDGLFEFGVEERITYEMEKSGKKSIDFDYVDDCERFSNFLELNGQHRLSELEINRKLDDIAANRKVKNQKKADKRAWRKATEKFPSGPKL